MTRDESQQQVLGNLLASNGRGYLMAPTGYGKTRVAEMAVEYLNRKSGRIIHIVVPKRSLKYQHEKTFKRFPNVEVFVVNTYTKEPRTCDFLIADECHWYTNEATKYFYKVIGETKYKFVLPMSATLTAQQIIFLEERMIPCIGNITYNDALKHGWIARTHIYNYGVDMLPVHLAEYESLYGKTSNFGKMMAVFDFDINTIIKCSFGNKPKTNRFGHVIDPEAVRIARKLGWRGNDAKTAYRLEQQNRTAPRGQRIEIWGDSNHRYHPNKITGYAVQAMTLIQKRKSFIHNYVTKKKAVLDIYNLFQKKTILFSESIEFAESIAETIGEKAVVYYSGMKSKMIPVVKTKEFKNKKSLDNFVLKYPEKRFKISEKDGKFLVKWKEEVKYGEKRLKEEALRKLKDNRYGVDIVCSARALDEGIDIPDLEIGIISSRTSVVRQTVQRFGRVSRLFISNDGKVKEATVFNVYLKGTKDEDWLKASQRGMAGVRWIDSLEEFQESFSFTESPAPAQ